MRSGLALLIAAAGGLAASSAFAAEDAVKQAPWQVARISKLSTARVDDGAASPNSPLRYLHIQVNLVPAADQRGLHEFRVTDERGNTVGELWGYNANDSLLIFESKQAWSSLVGLYLDGLGYRQPLVSAEPVGPASQPVKPALSKSTPAVVDTRPDDVPAARPDRIVVREGLGPVTVSQEAPRVVHTPDAAAPVDTLSTSRREGAGRGESDTRGRVPGGSDGRQADDGKIGEGKGAGSGAGAGSGQGPGRGVGGEGDGKALRSGRGVKPRQEPRLGKGDITPNEEKEGPLPEVEAGLRRGQGRGAETKDRSGSGRPGTGSAGSLGRGEDAGSESGARSGKSPGRGLGVDAGKAPGSGQGKGVGRGSGSGAGADGMASDQRKGALPGMEPGAGRGAESGSGSRVGAGPGSGSGSGTGNGRGGSGLGPMGIGPNYRNLAPQPRIRNHAPHVQGSRVKGPLVDIYQPEIPHYDSGLHVSPSIARPGGSDGGGRGVGGMGDGADQYAYKGPPLPPLAPLPNLPQFVLYISCGEDSDPGKVYQVDDHGRVLGIVNLPYTATGLALHRDHGLVCAIPRDGGKLMRIDETGKVETLLEKDETLVHPVDVGIPAASDTVVVADNITDVLMATTASGGKPSTYHRIEGQKWEEQKMSVAVTRDRDVLLGTTGNNGIYRFSGDNTSATTKPLLPGPGGVAADTATLKWAATQSPNEIHVFEGEVPLRTLKLPSNKRFYRQGLLSFAPASRLVVAARPADDPEGDVWLFEYDTESDETRSLFPWDKERMVDFVVGPRMNWDRREPRKYKSLY